MLNPITRKLLETAEVEADNINRAKSNKSLQPRFNDEKAAISLINWVEAFGTAEPEYGILSSDYDAFLRTFRRKEPHLGGVFHSVTAIDKNRGWTLTGGRNLVKYWQDKLLYETVGAPGSKGWRAYCSMQSASFWGSNLGYVTETPRRSSNAPTDGFYHVDPVRCQLTGKSKTPLRYTPGILGRTGKPNDWDAHLFFRGCSDPSDDEMLMGLGWCAVARALLFAKTMYAVFMHDNEQLGSMAPRGVVTVKGITLEQFKAALTARAAENRGLGREFFPGSIILANANSGQDVEVKLLALSQLPDHFDRKIFVSYTMAGIALCFGYDPSEFWPSVEGGLGHSEETKAQHRKASGKGGLDFALEHQKDVQSVLSENVLFEYEQRDDEGERLIAENALAKIAVINAMYLEGKGLLKYIEGRQLLAREGLIDEDWTLADELVTATDAGEEGGEASMRSLKRHRERMIDRDEIRRAIALSPREPIIQYQWPMHRSIVLWSRGEDAIHRHSYPIAKVKRATQSDIDMALEEYYIALSSLTSLGIAGDLTQGELENRLYSLSLAAAILMFTLAANITTTIISACMAIFNALGNDPGALLDLEAYRNTLPLSVQTNLSTMLGYAVASTLPIDLLTGMYDGLEGQTSLDSRLGLWLGIAAGYSEVGLLYGNDPNVNLRWDFTPGKQHCGDCAGYNGQIKTVEEWREIYERTGHTPKSPLLACAGMHCGCRFVRV